MALIGTLIGSLGTFAAFLWAVWVYRKSARDRASEQARRLVPVGDVTWRPVPTGSHMDPGAEPLPGVTFVTREGEGNYHWNELSVDADLVWFYLASTSDELFAPVHVWLVPQVGGEPFALPDLTVNPHMGTVSKRYYIPSGQVQGPLTLRLQFRDAAGDWWQRETAEPVKSIKGPDRP